MQPQASKASAVPNLGQLITPQKLIGDAQIPGGSINSIIYKPKKGITQVRTSDGFEYHFDATSGKLLNSGAKRTSFFIRLHEGSYFGSVVRDFVFLPSAIIFLISLLTGIYLTFFWLKRQFVVKHKKQPIFGDKQKANIESCL